MKEVEFSSLVGMTLTSIEVRSDRRKVDESADEVLFNAKDGRVFLMYHDQDCCESVYLESCIGSFADLIGSPITVAEEITSNEPITGTEGRTYQESFTYTFYKLATEKGTVDMRWIGESNGFYSEKVSIVQMNVH